MKPGAMLRATLVVATFVVVTLGAATLATHAAKGGNHCGKGIRACSASQVGQPCDPNNLNIICSAQANGSYCCLAYAP
ncbi:MAG TPA: hypothetical protein VFB67_00670 [Candidatus Polarisedimenticolaceae bacterium]|nr:hypothetical protein [Candidatus Polarisedimenticolaceae bacterium]